MEIYKFHPTFHDIYMISFLFTTYATTPLFVATFLFITIVCCGLCIKRRCLRSRLNNSGAMSNSESEDDPRNTSDEEWTARPKKKNTQLRKSVRLIKKAKTYTSSEDDCSLVQGAKVHRNGLKKRKPTSKRAFNGTLTQSIFLETTRTPVQAPTTFTSGAFVVAKHDAQSYDSGSPPHIWRIDGKALLQKFEPVAADTHLRYKNTSVYTGWSEIETDNYAVLKNISFIYNTPQRVEITVAVDEFKNILMGSE